jgi:hypothetical protein
MVYTYEFTTAPAELRPQMPSLVTVPTSMCCLCDRVWEMYELVSWVPYASPLRFFTEVTWLSGIDVSLCCSSKK